MSKLHVALELVEKYNAAGPRYASYRQRPASLKPFGLLITEIGRLFSRNIAMRFDSTLVNKQLRQYSKTL